MGRWARGRGRSPRKTTMSKPGNPEVEKDGRILSAICRYKCHCDYVMFVKVFAVSVSIASYVCMETR